MKKNIYPIALLLLVLFIIPLSVNILLKMGMFSLVSHIFIPLIIFIGAWTFIQIGYFIVISLFGYKKAFRDYKIIGDKTNFLIFIPAHNEADVISSTLKNLYQINYSKYEIVVIADNCIDDTAKIAKKLGATVIDTSDEKYIFKGVGKSKALQYGYLTFKSNGRLDEFDMILILDADNYVDPNILTELNSQWIAKGRPEAIQTYLDSKNIDNILSLGYAASYWTMNRFFQLAKYRLGLPNSIGGTGFAISTRWLKNSQGFSSTSLTEDLEMEIKIIANGGRVLWNHFTRIWDEKPTDLWPSMIQRFRWSKGHWYVAFTHTPRMFKKFFKEWKFKYIDQLAYLWSMVISIQVLLALGIFITWLIQVTIPYFDSGTIAKNSLLLLAASYFVPRIFLNFFMLIYGLIPITVGLLKDGYIEDNQRIKKNIFSVIKTNIAVIYFSMSYTLCQMMAIFNVKNQSNWSKTTHKINYSEHSNKNETVSDFKQY